MAASIVDKPWWLSVLSWEGVRCRGAVALVACGMGEQTTEPSLATGAPWA